MAAPRRVWLPCTSQIDQCLCCFLRPGVVFLSLLAFVNSVFCFLGEGALLLGSDLATGIAQSASGSLIPTGGAVDAKSAAHGGLIFMGVYLLATSILGLIAGLGRRVWAATGFYVMMLLDATLGIAISVILWFAGSSFTTLVAQIPIFLVNVYLVIVAKSYRAKLIEAASGAAAGGSFGGEGYPKVIIAADTEARSSGGGADFGVSERDVAGVVEGGAGGTGARVPQVAIDDEEDGDISRGRPAGRGV